MKRVFFIATLIYASVIYHRHRRAKQRAKLVPANSIDPENTLSPTSPNYSRPRYDSYNGSPTEIPLTASTSAPPYEYGEMDGNGRPVESGGEECKGTYRVQGRWMQELPGEAEMFELSAARSMKSGRGTPRRGGSRDIK